MQLCSEWPFYMRISVCANSRLSKGFYVFKGTSYTLFSSHSHLWRVRTMVFAGIGDFLLTRKDIASPIEGRTYCHTTNSRWAAEGRTANRKSKVKDMREESPSCFTLSWDFIIYLLSDVCLLLWHAIYFRKSFLRAPFCKCGSLFFTNYSHDNRSKKLHDFSLVYQKGSLAISHPPLLSWIFNFSSSHY